MRVLVLHSELGVLRGGGETFTKNLFTAFAKRGHKIAAAFVADRHGRYPIALPSCIEPIPIPGWWSRKLGQSMLSTIGRCVSAKSRFRAQWNHIQEAVCWRTIRWHNRRFQQCIERKFTNRWEDFDLVYVHGDTALAALAARQRMTVLRLPGPVTAEAEPELRTVHAVCANGDALASIRKFLGDYALELPTGIDRNRFKSAGHSMRSHLGWKEEDRVVGFVGRLTQLKGVDLLASAFRDISRIVPDAKLLIIGSGPEKKSILSVLTEEIARGCAHVEADVDHETLSEWYRAMDLLVMPSRYENFSNTILEAMACGIPFLASDVGGNRILARMGGGWLFEPASVDSLSSWMQRILENRAEMRARGKHGVSYLEDSCTWTASAKRLEEIIVSRLGVEA